MTAISVQDMLIKQLSGDYALHQIIFFRSAVGVIFSIMILQWEGGFAALRVPRLELHLMRGVLVVVANMCYFAALAVLPIAEATALFFIAPLLITLMAAVSLGEALGPRRIVAVAIGFGGVLLMLRPFETSDGGGGLQLVALLPIVAAFAYAMMQILTRKLGISAQASVLAIYIQGTFLVVGLLFWAVAGDGRFVEGVENPSLRFLLRAWRWPEPDDWPLFLGIGTLSAVIGYMLSQSYRLAEAAVVAPFEYVALPLAVFWGWMVWGELPRPASAVGIILVMSAGVYVFVRERRRGRSMEAKKNLRKW
ncbi:MAG: DMT family transporter [Rhodobacteraceae bacterium]|nr:DMT family transporter [Paracoccaceae bacterium]